MITLELEQNEVDAIIQVLGDLPTKSNAWPLVIKIKNQAKEQEQEVDEKRDE